MWSLAVDTATDTTVVGLGRDGEVVASSSASGRRHSRLLLPLVQRLLEENDLSAARLDLLGVGRGPGSFTGVRLGLTFAKSLSLALGVPLVGLSTLEAMAAAWSVGQELLRVPVLDAFKGQVYAAVYQSGRDGTLEQLVAPAASEPEQLSLRLRGLGRPLVLAGNGWEKYRERLTAGLAGLLQATGQVTGAPEGRWLTSLCWRRWREHGPDDPWSLEPDYCRPADAELARRRHPD